MTKSDDIFTHGLKAEEILISAIKGEPGWDAEEYGAGAYGPIAREAFKVRYMPLIDAASLIARLPAAWQAPYVEGLAGRGEGVPMLQRFAPDVIVTYDEYPACFLECKTTFSARENWSIEISAILAALVSAESCCVPQLFCFRPTAGSKRWTVATAQGLVRKCERVFKGGRKVNNGSGDPFITVPKSEIKRGLVDYLKEFAVYYDQKKPR